MATFSERYGYTPIRTVIQRESADEILRNSLWNALMFYYFKDVFQGYSNGTIRAIWSNFFNNRIDEFDLQRAFTLIKDTMLYDKWNLMFDLIESIPKTHRIISSDSRIQADFYEHANEILKKHLSAYRFVNKNIVEITSEEEIAEIELATNISNDQFKPVKSHLLRALQLLSDRNIPDYRNSIKESISAVEALSCIISSAPKATLGQSLKILEEKHTLHPSLKGAFEKLYGYTSDADGIRHSLLTISELKQEDAKFMLVACSAFINYLIAKNQ